ncbi:MAG: mechanosensitive ion channel family protein, partial [Bryobacteraceae bacterium]
GHWIKFADNEEGVVTDIGWRTTRVRNGRNSIVVIPNTKITSGVLTNYSLPEKRMQVEMPILAAYEADADAISKLAVDEAVRTPGVLAQPAPKVWFNPGFLPTHMQLTLMFSVAEFTEQGPALSTLRHRLHKRMREEGIPMPRVEPR